MVDDGSRDDTADAAFSAGAAVIRHPVNLGQGAALQSGIAFALSRHADYIVTFDADGQHDIADIERMIATLEREQADIAIGSRFLGTAQGIPPLRRVLLKAGILVTQILSGLRLTDAHNGLRVITGPAAARLRITQNRMAHASEIIEQIAALKLRYVEVPVTIRYTEYSLQKGQRTLDSLVVLKDLLIERFMR